TRLPGSVSVKPTPVSVSLGWTDRPRFLAPAGCPCGPAVSAPFGLVMVKLSEVVPWSGIVAAPNDVTIDGGAITSRLADAVFPLPPSVEVTAPVVLLLTPAVVPV